ncbi:MAG: DUF1064 domain-containing protein, partial [Acidobacteriales bacterium]|nr:DUF1064 domain-containing protein [Terriglobales bacterium]
MPRYSFRNPPPEGKYRNRKTNGHDSHREARRAQELRWMEKAGEIRGLLVQPVYALLPAQYGPDGKCAERAVTYRPDFSYWRGDHLVVEDV